MEINTKQITNNNLEEKYEEREKNQQQHQLEFMGKNAEKKVNILNLN